MTATFPAPAHVRRLRAGDGTELALHRWPAPDPRAVVFYLHGIQSHAGWLHETGPALAAHGVELAVLDRRGSGRSAGPRGHLPSADLILADYRAAFASVREDSPGRRTVLVGQSFGGSVLAAWHAVDRITTDALVFCAPALRQQRHRHDPDALAALRAGGGPSLSPLPLDDADYTSSRRHLSMMAADPLMVRQVSASTRSVLVDLEDLYADGWPDDRDRPEVFLAMPEHDAIIDLAVARRTLRRLAPATVERVFPADRHYLEFTEARRDYWQWLAAIAIGSESGRTSC